MYKSHLASVSMPGEGEQFREVNSDFVDFVCGTYLPRLLDRYPRSGKIGRVLKGTIEGAGAGTALVEFLSLRLGEQLVIGGLPLVLAVAGLGALALAGTGTVYLGRQAQREWRARHFRRVNNYLA